MSARTVPHRDHEGLAMFHSASFRRILLLSWSYSPPSLDSIIPENPLLCKCLLAVFSDAILVIDRLLNQVGQGEGLCDIIHTL